MKKYKEQPMSVRTAAILLCIAVLCMLMGNIGASLLQTSFGKVELLEFKIPTGDGKWISGDIFKPVDASSENKVPVVITEHGFLNNSKMQDLNAIELSRRGIAVIAFDAYFHGKSSSSELPVLESTSAEGTGMIDVVEFAWSNLDYVDNTRIGIMGHSMGAVAAWSTLMYYGAQYSAAIEAAKTPGSDGGREITDSEQEAADRVNKVQAGFPTAIIALSSEETFQTIHANVGISYGKYDEGNYDLARGNGDVSGECKESLAAVNSVMSDREQVNSVEMGKFYGNAEERTLRVIYNPAHIHPWEHFSAKSAGNTVAFFQKTFQTESDIPPESQIWFLKELCNLLGLIGVFFSIVPVTVLLLQMPVFCSLRGAGLKPARRLITGKQKLIFWGTWVLSWIISALSLMPVSKLDKYIFPGTTAFQSVRWFTQQSTNFILIWAVFNGIVGLAIFWAVCRSNRESVNLAEYGIKIQWRELVKTLLLAVCVFAVFYSFVFASEYFFKTDFRFWVLGVCTFTADKLKLLLLYFPFYFVFYFALSVANNITGRIEFRKEWVNVLVCGLGNILGIVVINAIQYITLFTTGVPFFQEDRLYPMVVLPLIALLFVAAFLGRSLYKLTGKVWLGAMVNCMILLMIGIANTATLSVL